MNASAASPGSPSPPSRRPEARLASAIAPAVSVGHQRSHIIGASYATTAPTRPGDRSASARQITPPKLCPMSTAARRSPSSAARSSTCWPNDVAGPVPAICRSPGGRSAAPGTRPRGAVASAACCWRGPSRRARARPAVPPRPPAPTPRVSGWRSRNGDHPQDVGPAGTGVGRAGQHGDRLAVADHSLTDGGLDHAPHHLVGRGVLVDQERLHAPGQRQLPRSPATGWRRSSGTAGAGRPWPGR